jgi:hypothetical protein
VPRNLEFLSLGLGIFHWKVGRIFPGSIRKYHRKFLITNEELCCSFRQGCVLMEVSGLKFEE